MNTKSVYKTKSLCPECLRLLNAEVIQEDNDAYMVKSCELHGEFKTVVWRGDTKIEDWITHKNKATIKNPAAEIDKGCPYDCGLCSNHRQHTCTALIEVTNDCNLYCKFCFAGAKDRKIEEPTLEEIEYFYKIILKQSGACNIQISGGEPTVRDDLDDIIRMGRKTGFEFIQLNTNGIRIGEDEKYLEKLKDAGLSSVYLQFDGTNDEIYEKIRGRRLLDTKINAINNCSKHGIGVVLVPLLLPHTNVDNIGDMIKFALEKTPTVRGIHFQPVSYFGRIGFRPTDDDRITLPEIINEIELQTSGLVKAANFKQPGCENSLCSFNGSFLYDDKKNLKAITRRENCSCRKSDAAEGAVKTRKYVSGNWKIYSGAERKQKTADSWDLLLNEIKSRTFSISAMAFQDADNVDIERVKDCCIHVVNKKGNLVPFCIYNITDTSGRSIYR